MMLVIKVVAIVLVCWIFTSAVLVTWLDRKYGR